MSKVQMSISQSPIPRVGITGGIGSGKSLVCRIFQETFGIPIFYADIWAKKLINFDPDIRAGLIALFGPETYLESGEYNRPYIAQIAFSEPNKLAALNALVHPAVERVSLEWHEEQARLGHPYTLKEAALMVESGSHQHLDFLIVVAAPVELRIQRVMERDGLTEDEVQARMRGQLPEEDKLKLADFIILNDGSQLLLPQVMGVHQAIMNDSI
jgi:dephospho-CoA kinase